MSPIRFLVMLLDITRPSPYHSRLLNTKVDPYIPYITSQSHISPSCMAPFPHLHTRSRWSRRMGRRTSTGLLFLPNDLLLRGGHEGFPVPLGPARFCFPSPSFLVLQWVGVISAANCKTVALNRRRLPSLSLSFSLVCMYVCMYRELLVRDYQTVHT